MAHGMDFTITKCAISYKKKLNRFNPLQMRCNVTNYDYNFNHKIYIHVYTALYKKIINDSSTFLELLSGCQDIFYSKILGVCLSYFFDLICNAAYQSESLYRRNKNKKLYFE